MHAEILFKALKLCRFKLEKNPDAERAIEIFRESFPTETESAERLFINVLDCDLNKPTGKAIAAKLILVAFGFDISRFYFHEYKFVGGITEIRSLDYYGRINAAETQLQSLVTPPYSFIQAQLPFAIPTLEGVYRLPEGAILIRHRSVVTSRATWRSGEGTRISAIMDPSGLYAETEIQLVIHGSYSPDDMVPPSDRLYENLKSYPEIIRKAVVVLNSFVGALRRSTGRCDIPEIVPANFNKITFRQVDELGKIVRNIESLSFEWIHIATGPPHPDAEANEAPVCVPIQPFQLQLLESAKLHVLGANARRAVLDFAGAFEAFVSDRLLPSVGDLREKTKERFLRIYDRVLDDEIKARLSGIQDSNDAKQFPSIHRIVRAYRRLDGRADLDEKLLGLVMKVYDYRNDAAHGAPIPSGALHDIIQAIGAFEQILAAFTGTVDGGAVNN